MVVPSWHLIEIGDIILIRFPEISSLNIMLHGAITRTFEVSIATILSISKEVVFFIAVYTHPGCRANSVKRCVKVGNEFD